MTAHRDGDPAGGAVPRPGSRLACLRMLAARSGVGILAGLFLLWPVLLHPGWPSNHDGLRPLVRAAELLGQWRVGHLLPIWSNVGQQAYGSPAPILYHKLFTALLALLLLVASPHGSLCSALLLVMLAGFLGTGLVIRMLAGRPALVAECLGGWALVSASYATTDWLVRGAVAEFTALCLLPLLFAWCVTLLQQGRCSRWIGPLMALLWLAHSGIALYCMIPLGLCVALAAIRHRRRLLSQLRPLLQAIVLFVLLVLPFVVAALPMLAFADTPILVLHFQPALTHIPARWLLADPAWRWGSVWGGMTIQIEPLLLAVAALLPVAIVRQPALRWPGLLMLLTASAVVLLQTHAAVPLFGLIPGLRYIQFTWRLLCFLDVALAIGLGIVLLSLQTDRHPVLRRAAMPLAAAFLLLSLPGKPHAPGPGASWFSPIDLAYAAGGLPTSGVSMEAPEYLPRVPGGPQEWPVLWQAARRSGLCTAQWNQDPAREAGKIRFTNVCPAGAVVALPVFLGPGMRATADGLAVPLTRGCDDPRPRLEPGRARAIVLRMPRLLPALADWWHGRAGIGGCR